MVAWFVPTWHYMTLLNMLYLPHLSAFKNVTLYCDIKIWEKSAGNNFYIWKDYFYKKRFASQLCYIFCILSPHVSQEHILITEQQFSAFVLYFETFKSIFPLLSLLSQQDLQTALLPCSRSKFPLCPSREKCPESSPLDQEQLVSLLDLTPCLKPAKQR